MNLYVNSKLKRPHFSMKPQFPVLRNRVLWNWFPLCMMCPTVRIKLNTTSESVNGRLVFSKARPPSPDSPSGVRCGQCGTGATSFLSVSVYRCQYHHIADPYSSIYLLGDGLQAVSGSTSTETQFHHSLTVIYSK